MSAGGKVFTLAELANFDGQDGKPVYLAMFGVVFDMSAGRSFYGPGGNYAALAGKDATRALAKMSLAPEDVDGDAAGLSQEELDIAQQWKTKFESKYTVVGTLAR